MIFVEVSILCVCLFWLFCVSGEVMSLVDEIKCIDLEAGRVLGRKEPSHYWHGCKLTSIRALKRFTGLQHVEHAVLDLQRRLFPQCSVSTHNIVWILSHITADFIFVVFSVATATPVNAATKYSDSEIASLTPEERDGLFAGPEHVELRPAICKVISSKVNQLVKECWLLTCLNRWRPVTAVCDSSELYCKNKQPLSVF